MSVEVGRDGDELVMRIVDDGGGFDPDAIGERPGHLGLRGMRERAAAVGGTIVIESAAGPGHDTSSCRLPWLPTERRRDAEHRYGVEAEHLVGGVEQVVGAFHDVRGGAGFAHRLAGVAVVVARADHHDGVRASVADPGDRGAGRRPACGRRRRRAAGWCVTGGARGGVGRVDGRDDAEPRVGLQQLPDGLADDDPRRRPTAL